MPSIKYKISKSYYNILSRVLGSKNSQGKVIEYANRDIVIKYLNRTTNFRGHITDLLIGN